MGRSSLSSSRRVGHRGGQDRPPNPPIQATLTLTWRYMGLQFASPGGRTPDLGYIDPISRFQWMMAYRGTNLSPPKKKK